MFVLRPYQQAAVDKTIAWIKHSTAPCLVEMSVGAGKSLYIAEVARIINGMSGKRVLCIAPRAELVKQNYSKYIATGNQASIYSASAGQKSLRYPVVFATPMSFKPVAKRLGNEFAAIIIDEGEGVTPVIRKIIEDMREGNPNIRAIGTTGTPFNVGGGYVYKIDENDMALDESIAKDPFYLKNLYRVSTRQLLDDGYLTQPVVMDTGTEHYETLHLEPNRAGKFDPKDIDKVFVGHGRKTATIIADAMRRLEGRKSIVFFAATIRHAEEIMASFHPDVAAVVHGKITDRDSILKRFADGRLRILINVNILTVGWDCPRVDAIVLMRATESPRLLAQIIGRCLRLFDGKTDAAILDYAENFEKHAKSGDIFDLRIKAAYQSKSSGEIQCKCPQCDGVNLFSARPNDMRADIDEYGYFVDLDGNQIIADGTDKPFPSHYGRRCGQFAYSAISKSYEQCTYYWSSKPCPACDNLNDIAARYCKTCREELIDPAKKLVLIHKQHKRDPTQAQSDEVLNMEVINTVSRSGNDVLRVTFYTPARMVTVYYQCDAKTQWLHDQYTFFMNNTNGGKEKPRTVQYRKDKDFYKVLAFNRPTDDERLADEISRFSEGSGGSVLPQQELPHGDNGANDVYQQAAEAVS